MYAAEIGTTQNLPKALELYKKIANSNLSENIDGKFDVRKNGEKAFEILRESAEQNFDTMSKIAALRMIAEMYDKSLAITEDKQKAAELYQESDLISNEWIQTINNLQIQV